MNGQRDPERTRPAGRAFEKTLGEEVPQVLMNDRRGDAEIREKVGLGRRHAVEERVGVYERDVLTLKRGEGRWRLGMLVRTCLGSSGRCA